MNGKSGSVHVTVLLILPSGDHRRLPGGSRGGSCGGRGVLGRGDSVYKGSEIKQHFIISGN